MIHFMSRTQFLSDETALSPLKPSGNYIYHQLVLILADCILVPVLPVLN
jgi:hypothetical protein